MNTISVSENIKAIKPNNEDEGFSLSYSSTWKDKVHLRIDLSGQEFIAVECDANLFDLLAKRYLRAREFVFGE